MGLRPTQGDEKRVQFRNHTQWKRRPPLCHLDRSSEGAQWRDLRCQRSFPGNVFRQGDEKRVVFSNYCLLEAPPSPLSSRPELRRSVVERSAVSAVLSWKCFSTGEVMGRWPAQGDEKRFSSNYRRWKRRPPLCHLDRSSEGAQWRDLRCQRSFPGNVFDRRSHGPLARPR